MKYCFQTSGGALGAHGPHRSSARLTSSHAEVAFLFCRSPSPQPYGKTIVHRLPAKLSKSTTAFRLAYPADDGGACRGRRRCRGPGDVDDLASHLDSVGVRSRDSPEVWLWLGIAREAEISAAPFDVARAERACVWSDYTSVTRRRSLLVEGKMNCSRVSKTIAERQ